MVEPFFPDSCSVSQSVVWTLQDGEQDYSISVADLGDGGGVQVTLIVGDA